MISGLPSPGSEWLVGAVDNHVHAAPHINPRSLDVVQAAEAAAAAGMVGLGLMDNFANTSGYAALVRRLRPDLALDVFGGLIMEPPAGGVSADAVRIALKYGYSATTDGARFISLPTHHTRHIAVQERRSPAYVEACLAVPERGNLPDPLPEILDLVAEADVVLNTGHVSGEEALRVCEAAKRAGVQRILVPASHETPAMVKALVDAGATAEFSFFFVSHATAIALTHVDAAANTVAPVTLADMAAGIREAGPHNAILSSDCGVGVLPPPVEGLREFLLLLRHAGIPEADLISMVSATPRRLFRVNAPA